MFDISEIMKKVPHKHVTRFSDRPVIDIQPNQSFTLLKYISINEGTVSGSLS
jgi:hypothetical protein